MVICVVTSAPFAVIRSVLLTLPNKRTKYGRERCDLYSSSSIVWGTESRIMGWTGHILHVGARRGLCKVLVGKTERHRRRWEDNIKMDLKEVERGGMHWIDVAQDRESWRALVNAVM
jgi:hypothetical protein